MGTVIQDRQQRNPDNSKPRWDRLERADLFEQYRELRVQGVSERQAAKELKVPRTTLQAWRLWHDTLDMCPHVAEFFGSGPGLAFLHRLVLAFHLVCIEVGTCGIRLACLFLQLTGLDRFVAASYGAQQKVNRQVEPAIGVYREDQTARLARDMPHQDITLTQDETFTGGLGLVGIEPVRLPPISKPTSTPFAPLLSTRGSARALWSASKRPSAGCRQCKRRLRLSPIMWASKLSNLNCLSPSPSPCTPN